MIVGSVDVYTESCVYKNVIGAWDYDDLELIGEHIPISQFNDVTMVTFESEKWTYMLTEITSVDHSFVYGCNRMSFKGDSLTQRRHNWSRSLGV